MRIAVVTQEEPFILAPALDRLCRARAKDIVALIILPSFNEKLLATARRLYGFYGPVDFGRLCIRYGWTRLADFVNGWRPVTRAYSVGDVARRNSIPFYRPTNIGSPEFIKTLSERISPDLIVSVAASQLFTKELIDIPALGCINVHSSPLPRYRGMMPNFWTLLHNEPEAAVSIHYMVAKLDAGDLIMQRKVPIFAEDSLQDLMVRSKSVGIEALLEAIDHIEAGTVQVVPMDMAQSSYFSFPTRSDAQLLRMQGRRLL
ncbi:methionyl-tRNA formyltransferase [Microvirga vignae]|uniref:methionyl-tRNA formyltransferase n=1 Tax=Microvirga vignae TaxID=1225564 RepID=UPI00069A2828|nr:formyltransferase family protein [Microvirga vignae]